MGVNLNPDQQRNFDCVYCEVDRHVPGNCEPLDLTVLATELESTLSLVRSGALREQPLYSRVPPELLRLRHVAISGDGEPTICPRFREAVETVVHVRATSRMGFFKIVLITNASNLDAAPVQEGLRLFTRHDEIWAKLDVGSQAHMNLVNKSEVPIEKILSNILLVARQRPVVIQSLVPAINGFPPSEQDIEEYAQRLKELSTAGAQISLVQIYSATRPTVNPECGPAIVLRSHQKAAVWRILQTPNTLLDHVVGGGKTYTMVAAAMELKRLGLAQKPLFAVPNHMLGQFSSELLTLYPGANILVATKDDFEKKKRKTLMSRIATGNWDAVIVTHSGLETIPLSRETQQKFFREQLRELELAILEQWQQDNSRIVKELERSKKKLETRLKELVGGERKDDTLMFEELGVDRLFVDEAHYFKNLFYVSKMTRIAGLPATASQRAFDMFLKVRHVQRVNGGGEVTFATGTPIANSVAEMFTMQRYLQMSALKAQRVDHFDSWAATFGEPVTAMELSPDGSGYRLNTRFARFINVPELMQQFRQVADIQTQAMLKLPVPANDPTFAAACARTPLPHLGKV